MLINKSSKIESGDVATFKLVNGDEIMAKVVSETDSEYVINRPRVVIITRDGQPALMPSMFTSEDGDVTLGKAFIMMKTLTIDQFKQSYTQQVTGLEMLPPGAKLRQ